MRLEERYWEAVQNRDSNYDGVFYYGVLTTKIYCNPSCKTRLALKRNVRFFQDIESAELSGLRPCKKCNPNKQFKGIENVVHTLCRYIEAHVDEKISLTHISKKSGYSTAHIQKAFLTTVGSSPKSYQQGLRSRKLKKDLKLSPNISDAIYGAGYGSTSRVYENLKQNIGMTPKQYRTGGSEVEINYASSTTNLGVMLVAATERGICFLQFADTVEALMSELHAEFPNATVKPMPTSGLQQFNAWMKVLEEYLLQKKNLHTLPLDIKGTAFQMLVWRYLQTIPSGEVRSYKEVAIAIGKPEAVRAVASACARNRIALAIPCHRVLRGDGTLAGYRWGVNRKRALLDHERRKDK